MVPDQRLQANLAHIDCWIFDLDNTLYPARTDLFTLIDARMTEFIVRLVGVDTVEARRMQKSYFHEHGTTLAGLMAAHGTDPHEFLAFAHDIELDRVAHDAALVESIARLPGRKMVFTNGDTPYAQRVLDRLGLGGSFEAIHDIHAMGLVPKPAPSAYAGMCARWGIDPTRALFAEDMVRNLKPAKAIGMTTLWIDNGSEQAGGESCPSFVDIRTDDLGRWLGALTFDTNTGDSA
ncbi:pyrimidine 5'-nucleotidase [Sphingomonas sp.]|uniref:pyrimidine 5'-nucleotidase n=1 Tax=Sphingomonas sp. TaxID=28214 RepID=UPI0025EB000B|nr:pyrimidine 5'-nucleotidase [Sphingomonas sp.]